MTSSYNHDPSDGDYPYPIEIMALAIAHEVNNREADDMAFQFAKAAYDALITNGYKLLLQPAEVTISYDSNTPPWEVH
jgi:hypothetical protein